MLNSTWVALRRNPEAQVPWLVLAVNARTSTSGSVCCGKLVRDCGSCHFIINLLISSGSCTDRQAGGNRERLHELLALYTVLVKLLAARWYEESVFCNVYALTLIPVYCVCGPTSGCWRLLKKLPCVASALSGLLGVSFPLIIMCVYLVTHYSVFKV